MSGKALPVVVVTLVAAVTALEAQVAPADKALAPVFSAARPALQARHIVVFRGLPEDDDVKLPAAIRGPVADVEVAPEVADAIDDLTGAGVPVDYAYGALLKGFAARLGPAQLEKLRANPAVEAIYQEGQSHLSATQSSAPWGLDRIDQRNLPLNQSYTYANAAPSAHVFVIDSGIRATHNEFKNAAGTASRVTSIWNSVAANSNTSDCLGHGTEVAAVAGGRTYGVAKDARLYALKVADCGSTAIPDAVLLDALNRALTYITTNNARPAVLNASLNADDANYPLEAVFIRLLGKGVHVVNSAGNAPGSNPTAAPDVMGQKPARLGLASALYSVAASTAFDKKQISSAYGIGVNFFAPGAFVDTAGVSSDTAVLTGSQAPTGTSFAAPFASGVVATCLEGAPALAPAELKRRLVNCATTGVLDATSIGTGSPNRLLYADVCACTAGPTYSDMATSYWAYPAVSCLDKYGIGFPCEAGRYCGTTALKRWEMAVYIVEARRDEANVPDFKAYFTDVPISAWWTPYVERFKELNITAGCGTGLFCPNNTVNRADMAVFIIKAIGQTPLTTYKGYFTDVPAGQYYTGYVEKAKELGIIAGCTTTTYCPTQNVTREQTASIVRNAFSTSLTCP